MSAASAFCFAIACRATTPRLTTKAPPSLRQKLWLKFRGGRCPPEDSLCLKRLGRKRTINAKIKTGSECASRAARGNSKRQFATAQKTNRTIGAGKDRREPGSNEYG